MADNDRLDVPKKKKRLNMSSLSMLDNIIDRNGDDEEEQTQDDATLDGMPLDLDSISITSIEGEADEGVDDDGLNGSLDDITKALDSILLSSKARNAQRQRQSQSQPQPQTEDRASRPTKSAPTHQEPPRKPNLEESQYLNVGDVVYTTNNSKVKVLYEVPSFEDTPTYVSEYMNKHYLLKWYNRSSYRDLEALRERYESLSKDVKSPACVLKPKAITKPNSDGCFGCVYTELNHDYFALKDIINGYAVECDSDVETSPVRKKVKFKSIKAMVVACINIAHTFNGLDQRKECIYSFSDEDLFIDINTGSVLWDTVGSVSDGKDPTIRVNPLCTYLAPEVLNGSYRPNVHSNDYTLSVVLFRILFHDHPLEGKAIIDDVSLDPVKKLKYYSDKAVFIFDPNDRSNRAVRGVNYTAISMWEKYPPYLRELFTENFCSYTYSPDKRHGAEDWIKALLHLKSDVLPCICGRTDFAFLYEFTKEAFYRCQRCGSKYHSLYFVKRRFDIPVYTGNEIYTTFMKDGVSKVDDVMGVVIDNKIHANLNGLKNVSDLEWKCTNASGSLKTLSKDEVLPIFEGTVIDVGGSIAQFDFIK